MSKSTDSEFSSSTIEKNPLEENCSNSSFTNAEISDEKLLLLIKNRLKAITLAQNDLTNIDAIEEKYNVNRNDLFFDIFGFNQDDTELSSNFLEKKCFVSKIDLIRDETDKIFKIVDKSIEESEINVGKQKYIQTIPKALVSIKFKIPFFFVNVICDHLNRYKNSINEVNKENSSVSVNFIDKLFEFSHKIFQNRNDLKKIVDLLNESNKFYNEKKSKLSDVETIEKINETNLDKDDFESKD